MSPQTIEAGLRQQGIWCGEFGSPFTAALCAKLADDYAAGGVIADILAGWPTDPIKDALALRLAGALHHIVLSEPSGALAQVWPKGVDGWTIDTAWAEAVVALKARTTWVKDFIVSPPQTNEVRRAIALFPGICAAAKDFAGPIDLLELGASAGLNLNMDQFSYATDAWHFQSDASSRDVLIDTDWRGGAPHMPATLTIRSKAACDQNPLDVSDPANTLLLTAYVWPDQPARLARLSGAIKLAQANHTVPDRADAAEWLVEKLATRATDALTIVYHSVFLVYPDTQTRERIIATMEAAGEAATAQAPLAWLRFEWPGVLGLESDGSVNAALELIQWPGGKRTLLATVDPHGRFVNWCDQA
jgi:hypothetical protein